MPKKLNVETKLKSLGKFFEGIPEIIAVFLFGSYGTETQTELSDIDFAIFFNSIIDLTEEADILGGLSDFLGTERVDLVNLNKAPLSIQFRAVSEGKIIYEKDYVSTCDFIETVMRRYQDYAIDLHFFYEEYDRAVKEVYVRGR